MSKEPQEAEKKVERFELVEVPTQTEIFTRDNKNNSVLEDKAVQLKILNTLESIKSILVR
jgi:hypothetical protein|tara:strand:+ start:163 stop:342 length:180 start_codon:yes stop_codon:yes gene_type:complete